VVQFVSRVFGTDFHAKRVESLTNGVDGVLHAASLGIRAIGAGLAKAERLTPRHAIKQVDRLLSNSGISMRELFANWVRYVVGERTEILVNFDWTEFENSDQSIGGSWDAVRPWQEHSARLEAGAPLYAGGQEE
jgi:hypothetical protein